ncbi:NAD-dependent epimerase/dehydratase family protein [Flavobacteriaceae bacterium]|nr:NAD-dependent epimerase/dehydratase family protein [Flavobacteriaceae bacterium]
MNILITGVAGLLGSRLADWILENDPDVTLIGIDNLSGGYVENINSRVKFYKLDLIRDSISDLFQKYDIDYVFHFAAYAAEGLSPFIRGFNYDNNLKSTARIVNQCIKHDVKRLIFTSTMAVYGHGENQAFDEKQTPCPIDPYGVAKYACEMDIKIAGEQHGLDWCIIRPHNVYGAKQNIWDKYRNVLGIWMYQHLNGKPMTIFGSGNQTRAFSYIDDSLEPLWNAALDLRASKQIINLGGIHSVSILEANNILKNVIGCPENSVFFEERHEVMHAVSTYQKSIDILGFKHETDLEDGLTKMWEWAKVQPMRNQFIWPSFELDKGLYSFWKNPSKI